ncbi:MAG: hypothetical protein ACRELG_25995, partial [Gemmataceae bacterium]
LLTLAEGEEAGGHWERELRGRFGPRALSEVIPHDETIDRAVRAGQIGSHCSPDSPAALQYRQLADTLRLALEVRPSLEDEQLLQALREAAQVENGRDACSTVSAAIVVPPPAAAVKPTSPSSARLRRLNRPLGSPTTTPPVRMKVVPAQLPSAAESSRAIAMPPLPQTPAHALAQLWPLWILLGAVLGGGLRFVPLTAALMPILIGLGVALLVIVAVLAALVAGERLSVAAGSEAAASRQAKKTKPPPRKVSVNARLTSLTSSPRRPRRGADAN